MEADCLKILMLEDSQTDTELIQRQLKKATFKSVFKVMMTKRDFVEALDDFKPDIILSDNEMPQLTATDALKMLIEKDLQIPFILVTGTVSEEFAAGIIKLGADDYILKDRLGRLPAAIEAALRQKKIEKEKRYALEMLTLSEEKYRRMMERVSDAFVSMDTAGNYTYVNGMAASMLRLKPEEMIGKNVWNVFSKEQNLSFSGAIENSLKTQAYISIETYFEPLSIWFESHIYPSLDGVSVFFRDITERKKAVEILQDEKDRFTKIAATSPGLIYSMRLQADGSYCFPYASDSVKEIFGFNYAEIESDAGKIFALIHPADREETLEKIVRTKKYLLPLKGEYRYMHPTKGVMWHEVNSLPVAEPGGTVICHGIIIDITERKNADAILQVERDKFSSIADAAPGLICSFKREINGAYYFPYSSNAVEDILGFPFPEICIDASAVLELIHDADREELKKSIETSATQSLPWKAGFRYMHPVKGEVWLEVNSIPVQEPNGNITWHGIVIDVTERKHTEAALNEERDKLAAIASAAPGLIYSFKLNPDGHYSFPYASAAIGDIFGLAHADVKDDIAKIFARANPDELGALYNSIAASAIEMSPWNFEFEYDHPVKGNTWLHAHATPSKDADATITWHGIISDITDRKKYEEALRNSEISLNEAQALTHISNWDVDLSNGSHKWSDELYKILGINKAEAVPSTELLLSFMHPQDAVEAQEEIKTGMERFENSSFNFRFIRKDGATRYGYAEWKFDFDKKGKPVRMFGILQDVTEARLAAKNLNVLEQKIMQQKILEQKRVARAIIMGQEKERNYIGAELHDNVCQILVGAKLHLGMAAEKEPLFKKHTEYPMSLIIASVEEIRALSHRLATPVHNIELCELIESLLSNFSKELGIKTDFVYQVKHSIAEDLKLNLFRIVQEQIGNITKHAEAKNLFVKIAEDGNALSLLVKDDGKGFEINKKRTGIGISNIKNRVDAFNGKIHIESSIGKGCITTIRIPFDH